LQRLGVLHPRAGRTPRSRLSVNPAVSSKAQSPQLKFMGRPPIDDVICRRPLSQCLTTYLPDYRPGGTCATKPLCTHLFRQRASRPPRQPVPISECRDCSILLSSTSQTKDPQTPRKQPTTSSSKHRIFQNLTRNAYYFLPPHARPSALCLLGAGYYASEKLPRTTRRHPLHGRDQGGSARRYRSQSWRCYWPVLCARSWHTGGRVCKSVPVC
jgi:hypothetical protein